MRSRSIAALATAESTSTTAGPVAAIVDGPVAVAGAVAVVRIARDKVDGPMAVVRNVGGNKIARDKVVGMWPWFALLEPKWLWMKTRTTTMMIAICFKIRRPSGSMIPKHHNPPQGIC
jgi:hypothetical protein